MYPLAVDLISFSEAATLAASMGAKLRPRDIWEAARTGRLDSRMTPDGRRTTADALGRFLAREKRQNTN